MDGIVDWWAVAGGWAIDLWLGTESRAHHDLEVAIRREDQHAVCALESDWTLWSLDPPGSGWRRWSGHPIKAPAFQLQARSASGEFDLFTEAADQTTWTFRRDDRIVRPVDQVIIESPSGIPVVSPAVQLLYMAASADPKNEHDFEIARPHLSAPDAGWLADAIATTQPGHRWLAALR